MFSRLLIFAVVFQAASSVTKTWKSERSRSIWQPKGPNSGCSVHNLVYQSDASVENQIPADKASIERVVLPEYGAIIIQDTNPIVMDYDPHSTCPTGWQNYMQQMAKPTQSWYSPDMWTIEGEKFNAAKPHIDRIPCECDTASISTNDTMSIEMAELDEVVVGAVRINGQTGSLQQLMGTQMGSMMLGASAITALETQCHPSPVHCGCHSPRRIVATTQAVCEHVQCPVAACELPVRPIGHCCQICGATLHLLVNSCRTVPNLNRGSSSKSVEDQLREDLLQHKPERNLLSQVQMYENFYANPDTKDLVNRYIFQMVIVDRGNSYDEFSTRLASVVQQNFPNFKLTSSGRAQTPGASSPFWTISLGTLCVVVGIYTLLYMHYEKQMFGGQEGAAGRFRFLFNSPFTFSRFDNVSMSGGMATIVAHDAPVADGTIVDAVPKPAVGMDTTSFDNPMFRVKSIERSEVIETIGPNVLNETGGDNSDSAQNDVGMECENLVDVSLES